MGQKFEAIRVTEQTHQKAKFLANKSGKSISQTVSELVDAIFTIGCTFSALNLSYDYCITESRVTITCEGANNLVCSEVKVNPTKAERKVKAKEVVINPQLSEEEMLKIYGRKKVVKVSKL
jgi:hypothetical protein